MNEFFSFLPWWIGPPFIPRPPITGPFAVKTFSIPCLIKNVSGWLSKDCQGYAHRALTVPVKILKELIADAQLNANQDKKMEYDKMGELLLSNSTDQDIIALAQNSWGDPMAKALFSAENYDRQADDARDYFLTIDSNGNILKKIKLTSE